MSVINGLSSRLSNNNCNGGTSGHDNTELAIRRPHTYVLIEIDVFLICDSFLVLLFSSVTEIKKRE